MPMGSKARETRSGAEIIAIRALQFLTEDTERLSRYLALTGIRPETLRAAAEETGFLASVLDYVAEDEGLLLAFADEADLAPETIERARTLLVGENDG